MASSSNPVGLSIRLATAAEITVVIADRNSLEFTRRVEAKKQA
ncbi:MAG: hypothetical protein AAB588_04445 [Patescibacteria group bacterium]